MATVTIGALFGAYESASRERVERASGRGGGRYGTALCAQAVLSEILRNCDMQIEVPDVKLSSAVPFLIEENTRMCLDGVSSCEPNGHSAEHCAGCGG